MLAIFGGKAPHNMGIFPGGALEQVTVDKIAEFRWRLERIRDFINTMYIPDILAVAGAYPDYFEIGSGCKQYLSYGNWDMNQDPDLTKRERLLPNGRFNGSTTSVESFDPQQIREQVKHSWYDSGSNLPPAEGQTNANPKKPGAYSFIKAPRYNDQTHEVGPLARMLVAYGQGQPKVKELIDGTLGQLNAPVSALFSTLGRHAARALETKMVADNMADWVMQLKPGEPNCARFELPDSGQGMGITEAPRGSLGHWIEIRDGKIANYQAVVPTTWNCSPRDDTDQPGACEQALEGTTVKDEENPFELVRIVRSYDPCLACSIHVVTPKGNTRGQARVF